jgi:hypothetical protein
MIMILFCPIILGVSGCDESVDLGGGYIYMSDGSVDYIYHKAEYLSKSYYEKLIPCYVLDFNYDESFIIAVQVPSSSCYMGSERKDALESGYDYNLWIAVKETNQTIGPLSYNEYQSKRIDLNVPEELQIDVSAVVGDVHD